MITQHIISDPKQKAPLFHWTKILETGVAPFFHDVSIMRSFQQTRQVIPQHYRYECLQNKWTAWLMTRGTEDPSPSQLPNTSYWPSSYLFCWIFQVSSFKSFIYFMSCKQLLWALLIFVGCLHCYSTLVVQSCWQKKKRPHSCLKGGIYRLVSRVQWFILAVKSLSLFGFRFTYWVM